MVDALSRFRPRRKKMRMRTKLTGSLKMDVDKVFLWKVFWCFVRRKQINIVGPVVIDRHSELEEYDE